MKVNAIITLLCASLVFASTDLQSERLKRRQAARANRSLLPREPAAPIDLVAHGGRRHVTYNEEWCGVILDGTGFTFITGTITVPTPKIPAGGSSGTEYSVSAWVGIDGDACTNSLVQTGIDASISGSSISYNAWYEVRIGTNVVTVFLLTQHDKWYPDYSYDFSGISISAGNTVKLTISLTSTTAGEAIIENISTGTTVTHKFTGEPALCEKSAEWIIEDFEDGGTLVPFANFGSLEFYDAYAIENGKTVYPNGSGGKIVDMQQGSTVVCSCSLSGTGANSDIICAYE
jgi:hypothetical protein